MPVGDEYGVEPFIEANGRVIERVGLFAALEHPAIHENAGLGGFHQISRARDFSARRANDMDFHDY